MQGIYLLLLRVKRDIKKRIGSVKEICFERGVYAYIGSAQKNMEHRIRRHLLKRKRLFWHIDYLTSDKNVEVIGVLYNKRGKSGECRMAKRLSKTEISVMGFGCSDCNCRSHLFKLHSVNIIGSLGMKRYQSD